MENILLLNQDYTPLNVTTLQRGFKLVFKGKAEVISHDKDKPIKTDNKNYQRPTVIRLLRYVALPYRKVTLSRFNVYRRDGYKCVYCGSDKRLELDHIVPLILGGTCLFNNFVLACKSCNCRKNRRDVFKWCKIEGIKVPDIIINLLEEQKQGTHL